MSGPLLKEWSRREHNSWELKQEPKKAAEEVLVASPKHETIKLRNRNKMLKLRNSTIWGNSM